MTSKSPKISSDLAMLLTLGWAIPVWLLCGIFAGKWMDTHWGLTPWATLSGALLGMVGAGYTIARAVKKVSIDPALTYSQSIPEKDE